MCVLLHRFLTPQRFMCENCAVVCLVLAWQWHVMSRIRAGRAPNYSPRDVAVGSAARFLYLLQNLRFVSMNILDKVDAAQLRDDIPKFRPGDTVNVHVKVIEGDKSRIQVFKGVVIRRQNGGIRETFTVRKISFGIGVERTFPVHSPNIDKLDVVSRGKVRVICVVRQPRSRNTASSSAWFLDVIHRMDTTPRFGYEAGRFCVCYG